jgi:hypothetical protein
LSLFKLLLINLIIAVIYIISNIIMIIVFLLSSKRYCIVAATPESDSIHLDSDEEADDVPSPAPVQGPPPPNLIER